MLEYAAQSLLHAFIAGVVTEALVRLWRVGDPDLRVAFRLLPLLFPLGVLPVFLLLAPARAGEWFADHRALFVSSRYADVLAAGVRVEVVVLAALGGLGAALFARDLLPFLFRHVRGLGAMPCTPEEARGLAREVEDIALGMGTTPPHVVVLATPAPLLLVRGAWHPTLVVSRGTLDRLDRRERRAALAHEVAHAGRRDPLLGWILMACRAVTVFNPVCQVLGRLVARETEWRADHLAARLTGEPLALAVGLLKLFRAVEPAAATPGRALGRRTLDRLVASGRRAAVESRCRRMLDAPAAESVPLGAVRLGLTGVALGILLFFVV
jgi:Zn-dependent protease with chaperone function